MKKMVFPLMPPFARKLMLTMHIVFSVGWLGAVLAYVTLAVAGIVVHDKGTMQVVYPALALIGRYVIVPCSFASLCTGLIQSAGTNWGFFKYYWITIKLLLTFFSTIILINHMPVVFKTALLVTQGESAAPDITALQNQILIHAVGGLFVLIVITVLSVYKPGGKIAFTAGAGSRGAYILLGCTGLAVLLLVLHLLGGAPRHHHMEH
jgi:hypothetical protein